MIYYSFVLARVTEICMHNLGKIQRKACEYTQLNRGLNKTAGMEEKLAIQLHVAFFSFICFILKLTIQWYLSGIIIKLTKLNQLHEHVKEIFTLNWYPENK